LSGTFSFEALMVYFRLVMLFIPIMIYHTVQLIFNVDRYIAQLEGIYKQDDSKHTQWISQFGREYQLKPLQQTSLFVTYIFSLITAIIAIFLMLITAKAMKIGCEQAQNRFNDFF
jgi:ABC-type lipoprotein release transport system permease subunit